MKGNNIPLAAPTIGVEETAAVCRALNSGRLSLGEERAGFEREFARRTGSAYAVAVSSGTAALHLAVCAAGIGAGDEVVTTPFSFVASTNCILYERARPVFVDIDPETLVIDANRAAAAINDRTRAILGVDIFGYPAPWQDLEDLAQQHRLQLIEDAAEALGAEYQGREAGRRGHLVTYSFYPNKQITTGEGGAVVTNDEQCYQLLQSLSNQGRGADLQQMQVRTLGFNYRMSELSAALGRVQLQRLDDFLARRRQVAHWYRQRLQDCDAITLPCEDRVDCKRSWFVYVVQLSKRHDRDSVITRLAQAGIASKAYLPSIHLMPHLHAFGYKAGDFPISEAVSASSLALPFFPTIAETDVDRVCESLLRILSTHGR